MAVAIVRRASPDQVAASSNIATYSNVALGPIANDRIVVVVVGTELASSTPSACTIDYGFGDTAMTAGTGGNFGAVYTQIYYLKVPVGESAKIKVTYSSTNPTANQNKIAVYTVTGGKYSSAGGDGSTDMDATDPLTTGSTVIGTGGGMIAVAAGATDGTGKTWANLTEDLDIDAGDFRFTTATSTSAGTATRTCTGGTNGEDGALSWIIFTANDMPTVALNSPADASSGADTTPTLDFTGTDANSEDVRFQVQIGQAYPNGYSFPRKKLTQNHLLVSGSADLTDVDLLFSRTDPDFKTTANGGRVQHASGYDIRFELADGTKLDHRIIFWSGTTGQLIARVKVPTLTYATDTVIYLYVGKAGLSATEATNSAVYDSSFKFVADLKEDPSGSAPQIPDETSNGYHMTSGGSMTSGDLVDGPIYKALDFDGSNDYLVNTSWASVIDENDAFTMEMWFNITSTPNVQFFAWGEAGASNLCSFGIFGNNIGFLGYSNDHVVSAAPYDDGAWHKAIIIHNGTTVKLIIDGVEVLSEGMTLGTNAGQDLYIARWKDGGFAPAKLSDASVSNVARTNGWAITRYNSERNPSGFWTVEDEITATSGTDSGFANPDVGGDTDPFTSGDNIQFTVQAGDELDPGTYYWRVRGIDPSGSNAYGPWSSVRSFTITGGEYSLDAVVGAFTLTGVATGLRAARTLTASQATFTLTGVSAALAFGRKLSAALATFALTGTGTGLTVARVLSAALGTFTLTGVATALTKGRIMVAAVATFALTGTSTGLSVARSLTTAVGSFALTGIQAAIGAGLHLLAGTGAFTMTGNDAVLTEGGGLNHYTLTADTGSFVLTGNTAGAYYGRVMAATVGAFTLTGVASSMLYNRVMAAATCTYAVLGVNAATLYGRLLAAAQAAYTLTGIDASLARGRALAAAVGSFTLTGVSAAVSVGRKLQAVKASYTLSLRSAGLLYSGNLIGPYDVVFLHNKKRFAARLAGDTYLYL